MRNNYDMNEMLRTVPTSRMTTSNSEYGKEIGSIVVDAKMKFIRPPPNQSVDYIYKHATSKQLNQAFFEELPLSTEYRSTYSGKVWPSLSANDKTLNEKDCSLCEKYEPKKPIDPITKEMTTYRKAYKKYNSDDISILNDRYYTKRL
ncbi:hypothetical protein GJ496_004897 [Pomphorhynchus laevis]|nr:hypothetical protein GJ496_004897 [Pomphorhynchus laevis]